MMIYITELSWKYLMMNKICEPYYYINYYLLLFGQKYHMWPNLPQRWQLTDVV